MWSEIIVLFFPAGNQDFLFLTKRKGPLDPVIQRAFCPKGSLLGSLPPGMLKGEAVPSQPLSTHVDN